MIKENDGTLFGVTEREAFFGTLLVYKTYTEKRVTKKMVIRINIEKYNACKKGDPFYGNNIMKDFTVKV